jgi:hypothetical protein
MKSELRTVTEARPSGVGNSELFSSMSLGGYPVNRSKPHALVFSAIFWSFICFLCGLSWGVNENVHQLRLENEKARIAQQQLVHCKVSQKIIHIYKNHGCIFYVDTPQSKNSKK